MTGITALNTDCSSKYVYDVRPSGRTGRAKELYMMAQAYDIFQHPMPKGAAHKYIFTCAKRSGGTRVFINWVKNRVKKLDIKGFNITEVDCKGWRGANYAVVVMEVVWRSNLQLEVSTIAEKTKVTSMSNRNMFATPPYPITIAKSVRKTK